MKTLRDLARGQNCNVRAPAICNWNPETTVLAHIRRASTAGTGQKPPDICAVFACSCCHDFIDRRTHREIPIEVVNDYILDAMCRQLCWYDKHEIVRVILA